MKPSYRIIKIPTTDTRHGRHVIIETLADGQERVVSEHGSEDDATEYLNDLESRADYWAKE